jgi:hypothetical protein
MKSLLNDITFGMTKKDALRIGAEIRKRFISQIDRISQNRNNGKFSHGYIYSPPGIGKTFTIQQQLDKSKIKYIKITGNISMYAFGIQLCVINYHNPERENIVVFVDDCDSLFSTEENCNMMKNVLDGTKRFTYEKSLQSQWPSLSEIQKESVEYHKHEDKMGFDVPTDTMTFIFASNFKLPVDDDIKRVKSKTTAKSILLSHKNAIRSRCTVGDFDLNNAELWGWISDVALSTDCLSQYEISDQEKLEILDFVWFNWDSLTERSIRLLEKMAVIINEYPDEYNTIWEIDFLKK